MAIKKNVDRFMDIIEGGVIPLEDALPVAEKLDPLLLYFVLRYLKETYGRDSQGPNARLLQFLSAYPTIARHAVKPKNEPMVEWFDDSHSMRSFRNRDAFVDLIIDKLEG